MFKIKTIEVNTKVRLRVQGLVGCGQKRSMAYALILTEVNGCRYMLVVVGISEAQSIAIAKEHMIAPRPLTHDLFVTFCQAFGVVLKEVYIYKYMDGVFYSELRMEGNGQEVQLDSRTSDAIALALRLDCPIYTSEEIMQECSCVLDPFGSEMGKKFLLKNLKLEDIHDEKTLKKWLVLLTRKDLKDRLKKAIENENYEYAKLYQDELNRRDK